MRKLGRGEAVNKLPAGGAAFKTSTSMEIVAEIAFESNHLV